MSASIVSDCETIVALSSGRLPAGIAVVRVSGPACREVLLRVAGTVPPPRRAVLRRLRDGVGATLDRGLVLFFEGPASVTGEDLAELHLHGSRAVVAACLDVVTSLPHVRLAMAGEFTRRAFENGRIDLTEAEGLADLLAAETEGQRLQALAAAGGSLRALYEDWMRRLVRARALLDASFDFADEGDVGDDVAAAVRPTIAHLAGELRAHLGDARRGEILRHGYRVAIVGPPNVGKSSLLNALAARDVAIVTPLAGTTRDVLEVSLDLRGIPVRLFDTAGLRETDDIVEAIGIERAKVAMAEADLVLELSSCDAPMPQGTTHVKPPDLLDEQGGGQLRIAVRTKSDLVERISTRFASETTISFISVMTGDGLSDLIDRIASLAATAAGDPNAVAPTRTRHRELVADACRILEEALSTDHPPEILAETLRRASDRLGALTGRVGVEDLLDVIFSEFCIGK